jgi:hypothetical protein
MPEYVYLFIIAALIGVVIFMYVRAERERTRLQTERKDLYDRIQAGSVDEYRAIKEPLQKPKVVNGIRMRQAALQEEIGALIGNERQE